MGTCPKLIAGLRGSSRARRSSPTLRRLVLLHAIEDTKIQQPFGDRSQVVIEPYLTDQWYVDAATLAKPAIAAVEKGETKFVPENWAKTYYEWMRNIEPWCVSRQLWWGHRIPAWYGPDMLPKTAEARLVKTFFVAMTSEAFQLRRMVDEASLDAITRPNADVDLFWLQVPDEDVLDTWFSSATVAVLDHGVAGR